VTRVRYLIVNGDDFGMSPGINRGILDAHRNGILGSTSLLVEARASEEAAALATTVPGLSVGLHADPGHDPAACRTRLEHQVARFEALTGRLPTHLDSHHDVHRDPALLPDFVAVARAYGLPLRGHGRVVCCAKFYGRWDGETHPEQVSVAGFERILDAEVGDGVTELACHPGYVDPSLRSSYRIERELELETLCDPAVRAAVARRAIALIGFRDARELLAGRDG
jgi:predicted glycoside hydrolase/deacetylase ChbG (UPF0249 family)